MRVEKEADLRNYTTIKIGGKASFLCFPATYEEIFHAVRMAQDKGLPVFFLGRGSNTIFGDYKGVVIMTREFKEIKVRRKGNKVFVSAECGVPLSELVKLAVNMNLRGIYRLVGFPATVGGAVAMNAGAFGCETSQYIRSLLVMAWDGTIERLSAEELSFGYRSSPFPQMGIVLRADFEFATADFDVKKEYQLIKERRKRTQPINMPTSGSTFKNPPGTYAGQLLEKVGMKGYRVGDTALSDLHANFLVNLGRGKFTEVIKVLQEAKKRVYEEFGIELEEEVRIVESCGAYGR
jgi:UDP-N-acetylmuramate dehydrogenase